MLEVSRPGDVASIPRAMLFCEYVYCKSTIIEISPIVNIYRILFDIVPIHPAHNPASDIGFHILWCREPLHPHLLTLKPSTLEQFLQIVRRKPVKLRCLGKRNQLIFLRFLGQISKLRFSNLLLTSKVNCYRFASKCLLTITARLK